MSAMELAPLGDVANLQSGVGFPLDMQGRVLGDYPLAKVGDISRVARSGQTMIFAADHYVDKEDLPRLKAKPIPTGSILFSKIGEAIRQNHRVIAGRPLLIDNNAMAAIPNARIESRFLYHFLRTVDFYALASATTVPSLRKSVLEGLPVPIPPLPEQRRIAEILDKADALRAKRRAALAQLDGLAQSIFRQTFGDDGSGRGRWPSAQLESIVSDTKLGLVRGSAEFGPNLPIPYVRMNAITRTGELNLRDVQGTLASDDEIEEYRLIPGDFLFNTRNSKELVGKAALYRADGLHIFNNNIMRIRFHNHVEPEFVAAAFKTPIIQHELELRKSGTTNVFAIYYKDLRTLPIPVPPIELQRNFARNAVGVEANKLAQRNFLRGLDALFASLQVRAFQGELQG